MKTSYKSYEMDIVIDLGKNLRIIKNTPWTKKELEKSGSIDVFELYRESEKEEYTESYMT